MKQRIKRLLSWVLTLVMVVGLVPWISLTARAETQVVQVDYNYNANMTLLRIRAGRPIHEMGTSVLLIFLTERDLTAMRNRTTLLRAKQSRAEQSRAEHGLTALSLRPAGRLKLNTTS